MISSVAGIIIALGSLNFKQGVIYAVTRQRCELCIKEYKKQPNWKIVLTGEVMEHILMKQMR